LQLQAIYIQNVGVVWTPIAVAVSMD